MRGIRNKANLGTILVGVLLTVFSFFSFTEVAFAASYKWTDNKTIHAVDLEVGNITQSWDFIDNNPNDANFDYAIQSTVTTCKKPKIVINPDNKGSGILYNYEIKSNPGASVECIEHESEITIGDVDKAGDDIQPSGESDYRSVTYTWADGNTIRATGTLTADFVKNGDRYYRTNDPTSENNCKDNILVDGSDPAKGILRIMEPNRGNCNESSQNITIANTAASPEGSGQGDTSETACSLAVGTSIGGKSVGWFVCAFSDSVAQMVSVIDDLINSNLQPDLTIFDTSKNGSSYHAAWNSFRVIALGFVVIAALIMVITQAAGLDILDAYTVRKVLPRLLVSAILITISWDVLEIFFRLSDAATIGLRSLIYAPFNSLDPIQLGGGSSFSGVLLGLGGLAAMGFIALLSFGLSALLAVALAFFILVLIKVALAGILIASPVFIAASILPGTQKMYEFGKGALISLLLAPVVVGALIALFRVGAVIAYNRDDGNAAINQIIAILLYFGAYFAILKGLSAVGGFAATITGFVSDRGKGLSDGLKKFRSGKRKEMFQKMQSGERFNQRTRFGKALNTVSMGATQIGDAGIGILPGSRRKHRALRDLRSRAAGERAMKSDDMQALQYDDDGIAAMFLSGGRSARRARNELRRLHTMANGQLEQGWSEERINNAVANAQAVGITKSNAIAAGTLGARNKFRSIGGGQQGIDAIDAAAAYTAAGDTQLEGNIRDGVKYWARTSGRTDLAADDMETSWGRADMSEHAKSAPVAMRANMEHMGNQYRLGNKQAILATLQQQNRQFQPGDPNWLDPTQLDARAQQLANQDRANVANHLIQQRAAAGGPAMTNLELNDAVNAHVAAQNHTGAVKLLEAHNILGHGTNAETQGVINEQMYALGFDEVQRSQVSVENYLAQNSNGTVINGQALRTEARTWDSPDPSTGQAQNPGGVGGGNAGGGFAGANAGGGNTGGRGGTGTP